MLCEEWLMVGKGDQLGCIGSDLVERGSSRQAELYLEVEWEVNVSVSNSPSM